ncbi:MAG: phage portal protein [Desulfosporosinus sp.]
MQRAKLLFSNQSFSEYVRQFVTGEDMPNMNQPGRIDTLTAMKYTAVFACIRVLSETLASTPIMLYRKKNDGDREVRNDLAVYDILHNQPNEEMSPFSFKEMCMVALNTGGNAVCQKLRQGDNLIGLYPYEWPKVNIGRDPTTKKLIYKVRDGATELVLQRENVFHIPGISFDGIVGLSPIEYATSAIQLGLSYEQFGVNFYKNGANSSGAFSFPGELGEESFQRLKKDLKDNYAGLKNTGTPMLLEGGGKFEQFAMKPADAQLIENKRFQIEDVARIYRVPMHLIQELSRSTNNNIEKQSLEFIIYTMLPWFKRWEEAINMQLLVPRERREGYYLEFNVNSLLRGDIKSRYEAYAMGIQWGILCINDCLKLENMNSVEGGDRRIQPLNMININKADDYYTKEQTRKNDQAKVMAEQLQMLLERGAA